MFFGVSLQGIGILGALREHFRSTLWERPIFLGKVGANRRHSRGEYFLYVPVPEPVAGSGSLWICEHPIKTPPRLRLEKPDRVVVGTLGQSENHRRL